MIQIDEMVIRVPGMSETDARQLGHDVAERMIINLHEQRINKQEVSELNIQLSIDPAMNRNEMAERIATRLLQQLNMI